MESLAILDITSSIVPHPERIKTDTTVEACAPNGGIIEGYAVSD